MHAAYTYTQVAVHDNGSAAPSTEQLIYTEKTEVRNPTGSMQMSSSIALPQKPIRYEQCLLSTASRPVGPSMHGSSGRSAENGFRNYLAQHQAKAARVGANVSSAGFLASEAQNGLGHASSPARSSLRRNCHRSLIEANALKKPYLDVHG